MGLHVVLYQPEIPQNTGNVMRTCAGTGTILHLIEPLGFRLDPKALKRFGANCLEGVVYDVHSDWNAFIASHPGTYAFFTRHGDRSPDRFDFNVPGDVYLVFGRESTGLPQNLREKHRDACVRIPMNGRIRSLNLANAVCVGLYEALRQRDYEHLSRTEPAAHDGAGLVEQN